ncbi:MAG: hypothetical protein JW878_06780 [Methanomicrobia archaeon]|nr:hypothetical protein [Methanomicrobia archaeon]
MKDKRLKKGLGGLLVAVLLITSIAAVISVAMGDLEPRGHSEPLGLSEHCFSGYKFDNVTHVGLEGWTINVTANGWGSPTVQDKTDENGYWQICVYSDTTTYKVTEVLQPGWTQIVPASGFWDVPAGSVDVYNLNFENININNASIGDYVWYDLDEDGIQDPGEQGIANVTVNLYHHSDPKFVATMKTDTTGYYHFSNLPSANYSLEFVLPDGYGFSPPNRGDDDARDSDSNTCSGKTAVTILDPGEYDLTWDSGMYKTELYCISGYKLDNATGAGLTNWTIFLDANGNGELDNEECRAITTGTEGSATGADGYWEICGLVSGDYTVCEILKPGWTQIDPIGCHEVTITNEDLANINFTNSLPQCGLTVNKRCSVPSPSPGLKSADELKLGCNPTPTPTPTPTPPVFTDDCECMSGTDVEVTYSYEVTNTGDDLTNVIVEDDKLGTIAELSSLARGETQTFTETTTITETTTNTVTVTGEFPDGSECSDTDTTTVTVYEPQCGLVVNKTCSVASSSLRAPVGIAESKLSCTPTPTPPVFTDDCECTAGTEVTYKYEVTNTGPDYLTGVIVYDNLLGNIIPWRPFTINLGPGETRTFTKTKTIFENTTNIVTVTYGEECSDTDTTTVTVYEPETIPGTGTPGYWKNHPEAWPVDTITIGGKTYTKAQAIALMSSPEERDKTYTMFRALVAAKLNVLIGNDDSCIKSTIEAADRWMARYGSFEDRYIVQARSTAWRQGERLYRLLDAYNNGLLCAPHRD